MLASLISSLLLEMLSGKCLVTWCLSKMPWVRRYCCHHEKSHKIITWGLSYTYFNDSNIAGWEVYTVDCNIFGRLYCSFRPGLASHPCHAIMLSTSCHCWCSHNLGSNQAGGPGTSCIFSCSSCSRADNWLNQNSMQIGIESV